MFTRKILPSLQDHLTKKQVTVLTGMRRTGKTTLIKSLLESVDSDNKLYLDLQILSNQDLFSSRNFEAIVDALEQKGLNFKAKIYLALDEIQLAPELPGIVKYLYDNYNIKFLLTGPSSYYIKRLFSESLAGRKKIFELFPLDFGEFLIFKGVKFKTTNWLVSKYNQAEYDRIGHYYQEYIKFGGFPEVVMGKNQKDKLDLLEDIISSYINIDIATLDDFENRQNVYNLIKVLATRVGSRVDYSKLSKLAGIERRKLKNYFDLFASTYLISLISVHTTSNDKEIVKAKKIYFCDNGILAVLAEVDPGHRFENCIFNQLRGRGDIKYYSLKQNDREIDFVLNGIHGLEVKVTPTITDLNSLESVSSYAKLKEYRLIGSKKSPLFKDFIWGGDIK